MENQNGEDNAEFKRGNKRKKKRSVMQMAKKFARRRYNNDGQLDTETYQYMIRILDIIRNEFSTMDDKEVFINNIYEQTAGREVEFVKNQVGSRVFDTVIRYANCETIVKIYEALKDSLRPLCSDRFSSHVIQKLMYICTVRGNPDKIDICKSEDKKNESEIQKYNNIAIKLCKYVINNIEEFVWDTYANHVIRTAISCLGGVIPKYEDIGKHNVTNLPRIEVDNEYKTLFLETCKRIYSMPQFQEFSYDSLTSGFLQSILFSLKEVDPELNSKVIKKIQKECFPLDSNGSLSIFENESNVRLIEACIIVSTPEDYKDLYKRYFENHLKDLCLMKCANFCVQRLIEYCHEKEDYEKLFDDISKHLESILQHGHTGILVNLAKTCCRLHAKQGPFVNLLSDLFKCNEPQDRQLKIFQLVVTLKKYEEYFDLKNKGTKIPINLNGSLIIQETLKFNKPIKIVNSLLAMEKEELMELFDDPKGSHVMDAFMDSTYIGEKSREKLFKSLRGTWSKLACGVHGSRSLEKMWAWSSINQQTIIMDELMSIGQSLISTNTGRLLSVKLNVPLYSRSKKEWIESQGKEEKTKTLFADIIQNKKKVKLEKKP